MNVGELLAALAEFDSDVPVRLGQGDTISELGTARGVNWEYDPEDAHVLLSAGEPFQLLRKQVESLAGMLERMETGHVVFVGPDGEKTHPEWCRECRVERIEKRRLFALLQNAFGFKDGAELTADGSASNDLATDLALEVQTIIAEKVGKTAPVREADE